MTNITLLFRPRSREAGAVVFSLLGYVLPLFVVLHSRGGVYVERARRGTAEVMNRTNSRPAYLSQDCVVHKDAVSVI